MTASSYYQIAILITLLVTVLHKLLKLWIKLKNGRKIRLRLNKVEIEASQLSIGQFLELFNLIRDYIGKSRKESKEDIKSNWVHLDN